MLLKDIWKDTSYNSIFVRHCLPMSKHGFNMKKYQIIRWKIFDWQINHMGLFEHHLIAYANV